MRPSSRIICLTLLVGSLLGTRLLRADDDEQDAKDLARLQGKWQVVGKDATGAEVRIVKTVKGNRETLEQFVNNELIHAHVVDFKLRRTDEIRVFSYSNMLITAGPNKGGKGVEKGSYIYQVRGDHWITIEGFINDDTDDELPVIRAYTRVKSKDQASALPARGGRQPSEEILPESERRPTDRRLNLAAQRP